MIKAAAAAVTIAGLGICGILKALRYKERAEILSDFIQAAEKMKMEMLYRRESMPDLILRMANLSGETADSGINHDSGTPSVRFFTRVTELYENAARNAGEFQIKTSSESETLTYGGASLRSCWIHAADEIYTAKCLTHDDREAIKELGCELGKCGMSGQERIFDLALIKLRALLSEAEEEKRIKGRMHISLGFTAGITIVILLI